MLGRLRAPQDAVGHGVGVLKRRDRSHLAPRVVRRVIGDRGVDRLGQHGGDVHVRAVLDLAAQALRERAHGELAGHVGADVWRCAAAPTDDMLINTPAALAPKPRNRRSGSVDLAEQVRLDDLAEVRGRKLVKAPYAITPALLTDTSIRPKCCSARSASRLTASSRLRGRPSARPARRRRPHGRPRALHAGGSALHHVAVERTVGEQAATVRAAVVDRANAARAADEVIRVSGVRVPPPT